MNNLQLTVALDEMRFYAYHGALEQERIVGGEYTVSLNLRVADAQRAIFDDELAATVNYAEAYELVRCEMKQPSALLEHVAGRILTAIFNHFPTVVSAEVRIRKNNPPISASLQGASITLSAAR